MAPPNPVHGSPPTDQELLLIHQVTGTFLQSENQTDDTLNDEVQNENHWPLPTNKSVVWQLHKVDLGEGRTTYLIENRAKGHYLTFRPGNTPAEIPTLSPVLRQRNGDTGSSDQRWDFHPIPGTDAAYWAIMPHDYDTYALSVYNNHLADDQWIVPTPTWNGPPALAHAWGVVLRHRSGTEASSKI
ncbi:hypothetical protein HCN51_23845 [Nonomuraea sp. FMUSA5-5]|uniref:Ricin B lectin domain-containing protein n=1 Tax=Nonomuraea composti TaxID=2720023 RepID=A0ABX1BAZ7_9ACTN|nr:hypothetical protein [Nonomuraea sp. FMUSA5-5]NJP92466.1 hypothetical protein [Nonomuraea sp. FMUSA5-5]